MLKKLMYHNYVNSSKWNSCMYMYIYTKIPLNSFFIDYIFNEYRDWSIFLLFATVLIVVINDCFH